MGTLDLMWPAPLTGVSFVLSSPFASLDVENAAAPEILPSRKRETTLGVLLASAQGLVDHA